MGCNCQDTAKKASKYTSDETVREVHGTERAAMFISKIFIVISLFVILIITTPMIIVCSMYLVFTGKTIKLGNLFKKHGKRKQVIQNQD